MKFWDASAILPLLVEEPMTGRLRELYQKDPVIVAWWGTEVECVSALSRVERENPKSASMVNEALGSLDRFQRAWHEVQPVPAVRETARRLLRVHALRAADALQLAAAFIAAEDRPVTLEFVCLDQRLVSAARREGFQIPLA